MGFDPEPKGVMDETYARDREKNPAVSYRFRTRALTAVQAIQRHLKSRAPLKILDLGSADGRTLLEMARLLPAGTMIMGVEYSPKLVALSRQISPETPIVRGNITALPASVKDRAFDVVTALAVLEHLAKPVAAFKEAAGVLKPGGILVATCPQPYWDVLATRFALLEDHHESGLSRRLMQMFAEQAGLEVLEYQQFMFAPIGFLPYLRMGTSPELSCRLDGSIRRLRVLSWLFINQLLIARKA